MTDHNLRDIASRCEAKLHGFRRTADGVVVSFVLHPAEVPPVLALDPLGTRYMLAFVAIDDSEQPIPGDAPAASSARAVAPELGINRGNFTDAGSRTRYVCVPDNSHCLHTPGPECAGCAVDRGWGAAGLTPKARYAAMTAGEHARSRAGRLPREDERFRFWAAIEKAGFDAPGMCALSEEDAAQFIRDRCCGGKSRRLIAEDPEAMDKFIALETAFKIAVGEIAEPR